MKSLSDKCPCRDCVANRHPGCHSNCKSYIQWRSELDKAKMMEKEKKPVKRLYRRRQRQVKGFGSKRK